MMGHPTRDQLLGLEYDLLEPEAAAEVSSHLASCSTCLGSLEELREMERELIEPTPDVQGPGREWSGVLGSAVAPILVMAVSVLLSALPRLPMEGLISLPLLVGALLVTAWLWWMVRRAELQWRDVCDRGWRGAMVGGPVDRLRWVNGLRMSVSESLKLVTSRLQLVLLTAILMVLVGMGVVLWAGAAEPALTTSILVQRTDLVPGALAMGLLLAGSIWSSWRQMRLAREVVAELSLMVREATAEPA